MIDIQALIISCMETVNEVVEGNYWKLITPDTGIMNHATGELMDSIDFVRLLMLIEDGIFKQTGKSIKLLGKVFTLAESPFKTVATLEKYIKEVLDDKDN
jgi:acyl carrier protein